MKDNDFLEGKIKDLLAGIDSDNDDFNGWWETSTGAQFGGEKLDALLEMVGTDFDRVTAERDALQQRLTAADERADRLERALRFYADGDHLLLANPDAWDTCSGEPVNFLHDDAGTASVEDGSIAKVALKPAEGCGDE